MLGTAPRKDILVCLVVGLIAALFMGSNWTAPTFWEADGLYYEAQKLEVEGLPREQALHKVFFTSHLADRLDAEELEEPPGQRSALDPRWVEYSSRFYRRRWAVPVAAAAITPVFGDESMKIVTLLG